jgi:hypothetical protein
MNTTQVWVGDEFLGRIAIAPEDWRFTGRWRTAALAAARRVFGEGRHYHVSEEGPIL